MLIHGGQGEGDLSNKCVQLVGFRQWQPTKVEAIAACSSIYGFCSFFAHRICESNGMLLPYVVDMRSDLQCSCKNPY